MAAAQSNDPKPAKAKSLVVTAPVVQVVAEGGRSIQLYRGAPLDGVADSEVARLIDLDMVGENKDGLVIAGIGFDYTKPAD